MIRVTLASYFSLFAYFPVPQGPEKHRTNFRKQFFKRLNGTRVTAGWTTIQKGHTKTAKICKNQKVINQQCRASCPDVPSDIARPSGRSWWFLGGQNLQPSVAHKPKPNRCFRAPPSRQHVASSLNVGLDAWHRPKERMPAHHSGAFHSVNFVSVRLVHQTLEPFGLPQRWDHFRRKTLLFSMYLHLFFVAERCQANEWHPNAGMQAAPCLSPQPNGLFELRQSVQQPHLRHCPRSDASVALHTEACSRAPQRHRLSQPTCHLLVQPHHVHAKPRALRKQHPLGTPVGTAAQVWFEQQASARPPSKILPQSLPLYRVVLMQLLRQAGWALKWPMPWRSSQLIETFSSFCFFV